MCHKEPHDLTIRSYAKIKEHPRTLSVQTLITNFTDDVLERYLGYGLEKMLTTPYKQYHLI